MAKAGSVGVGAWLDSNSMEAVLPGEKNVNRSFVQATIAHT